MSNYWQYKIAKKVIRSVRGDGECEESTYSIREYHSLDDGEYYSEKPITLEAQTLEDLEYMVKKISEQIEICKNNQNILTISENGKILK